MILLVRVTLTIVALHRLEVVNYPWVSFLQKPFPTNGTNPINLTVLVISYEFQHLEHTVVQGCRTVNGYVNQVETVLVCPLELKGSPGLRRSGHR